MRQECTWAGSTSRTSPLLSMGRSMSRQSFLGPCASWSFLSFVCLSHDNRYSAKFATKSSQSDRRGNAFHLGQDAVGFRFFFFATHSKFLILTLLEVDHLQQVALYFLDDNAGRHDLKHQLIGAILPRSGHLGVTVKSLTRSKKDEHGLKKTLKRTRSNQDRLGVTSRSQFLVIVSGPTLQKKRNSISSGKITVNAPRRVKFPPAI